eukprot:5921169-Amphidinium_carterae.2
MDDGTKSVTVIALGDSQDKYATTEVTKLNATYPVAPVDGEDGYDEVNHLRDTIRKMRGGERAQQFSLLRAIIQPNWTSETRQFTRQYYKWLEDIIRYEAENGHGSITDHVKIATVVNNLKGNIARNLMMRIYQATAFNDVHQWISNYFNSTCTGTDSRHE